MIKSCLFPTWREAAMGLKVLLSCCVSDTNDMTRNSLAYVILMHAVSVASSLFYSEKQSHTQKSRHGYISGISCPYMEVSRNHYIPGAPIRHDRLQELRPRQLGRTTSRTWRIIGAPCNPNCQRHRSRRKTLMLSFAKTKKLWKTYPPKKLGKLMMSESSFENVTFFLIWWRFFFVIFVLFASSTLAIEKKISSFWWDGWCPDPRQYAAWRIQVCLIRASIYIYIYIFIDM